MILVDPTVAGPSVLDPASTEITAALDALAAHHLSRAKRPPALPEPRTDLYAHAEVLAALNEVFHGKCGYCETPIDALQVANVDHYRPTSDAVSAEGAVDHHSYWWLSYDWRNLILSCVDCRRVKGNRFPVASARDQYGQVDSTEGALLLDPRAEGDAPDRVLIFALDGTVSSVDKRGRTTIDVVNLNRARLVAARRDVAAAVLADHRAHGSTAVPELAEHLSYLGLRRQLWAQLTADASLTTAPIEREIRAVTKTRFESRQQSRVTNTLSDDLTGVGRGARFDYYSGTRWIERIEARNVRPIRDITLDLGRSTAASAPWMMLLGDNGSGKSSLLQALALALIGADYRRRIGLRPDDLLRHGTRKGYVKVWLSNLPEPVTLEFAKGADEFTGTAEPQVMVLAYGATRLRGSAVAQAPRSDVSHVENLFDARHDLTNPTEWLLGLDDTTFEALKPALSRLLALESHNTIVRQRSTGKLFLVYGRQRDSFSDLSDGYQSMLVLACDVMRTMLSLWPSPDVAEGIVIIDEIGTHLHPRWRMRITAALREVLPRVQFVVSTHDPLCLRGLEDGEITVINRNQAGEVVTLTDVPSVRGLRVDQLLTSEIFGLGSAQDPAVDALYQEYYSLRGVAKPTDDQTARIAVLEADLDRLRQLGVTQRERLMLSTADQLIADRRQRGDVTARPDLAGALADLWRQAGHA